MQPSGAPAKTHSGREGSAELKQLHCTWFKSRWHYLFPVLEQLPDENSVSASHRPLGQPGTQEISPMAEYRADLHAAEPDLFFVCRFKRKCRAKGERRAGSNMW